MKNAAFKRPFVIAIVGAEGSGKTFLTKQLKTFFAVPAAFEFGKEYCLNNYQAFYQNQRFHTNYHDFLFIAKQTYQRYHFAFQTACEAQAQFCLLDTDLIYTDWFFQLQFPDNHFLFKHYLPFQKVDFYFFLAPSRFVQHQIHYYDLLNKGSFSTALLKKYSHYKHPHSKLIVIRENDYSRRLTIIKAQIERILNENRT